VSKYGLEVGSPALASAGPMTFGPEGILFMADNRNGSIVAIDVDERDPAPSAGSLDVEQLDSRLAAYLGCPRDDVVIADMAVHPITQTVYLSVNRGRGSTAVPLLIRVTGDGEFADVALRDVAYAERRLEDAPDVDDPRQEIRVVTAGDDGEEFDARGTKLRVSRDSLRSATVTDMAWIDGTLLVAGASNEEFSSTLRQVPFPFTNEMNANSLEIFHVSHGRYETASPIRTFVPYDGNTAVLASYTCTPVVRFSLTDLSSADQAKGRTVAELGAMNTPIDMVSYDLDGEEYLLVSNSRHPLIKISCRDIDAQEPLTEPQGPVGVARQALPHEGVTRMANRGNRQVLMLQRDAAGDVALRTYATSSL
jgi:hypothetical protein